MISIHTAGCLANYTEDELLALDNTLREGVNTMWGKLDVEPAKNLQNLIHVELRRRRENNQ
jgi:hypothetical protein